MSDEALRATAETAGLVDPDLLKLVRPGIHAHAAVEDLRSRFPGAFRSLMPRANDVRDMSAKDAQAEIKRYLADVARYEAIERERRMTERTMERAREKLDRRSR